MTAYIKSKKFGGRGHDRGMFALSALICFSIFCSVVFCLVQANNLVGCSYEIREQKERITVLETEARDLESLVAQWRSPSNLENLVQSLGMVEAGEIIYLEKEKMVAVKD
ncbi:hypothetical protein KKG85_02670 [Patescibacteria group bacterium]|nr:hypothetical protein [Patescibacteria group bacterium]MBU2579907.1 hypothetical protein [Patescibacteria group bacterium]